VGVHPLFESPSFTIAESVAGQFVSPFKMAVVMGAPLANAWLRDSSLRCSLQRPDVLLAHAPGRESPSGSELDWFGVRECGDLDVDGAAVYQAASLDDAVSQPPVTGHAESVPALSKRAP